MDDLRLWVLEAEIDRSPTLVDRMTQKTTNKVGAGGRDRQSAILVDRMTWKVTKRLKLSGNFCLLPTQYPL